jgi:DNA-directed RNA polymerase subunit E"
MARKVCRSCKIFVEGSECPLCKGSNFSDNWKGRIVITDVNRSEIAKKMGITVKGEYAIKVR